jgi:tetratricopeptide (TPR) repeat protein
MAKSCPSCGRPASGRFCSSCGASLAAAASCAGCSAALPTGARFCTECGAEASGRGSRRARASRAGAEPPAPGVRPTWIPWAVVAVAVVVLGAIALYPRTSGYAPASTAFQSPMTVGGPGGIDLGTMSPREAADRLFDRIMRTAAGGDTAGARSFLPMALDAYAQLPELDADARYHLGVMHLLGGDAQAAAREADQLLAIEGQHLFGLFVAAQAARDLGDVARARGYYQRFLEAYPTEIARELPEYQAHGQAFPEMRAEAQAFAAANR